MFIPLWRIGLLRQRHCFSTHYVNEEGEAPMSKILPLLIKERLLFFLNMNTHRSSFCIIQAGICHCGTYPPPLAHTNSTDKGGDKFPRNVLARSVFFYTFNKRIIFLHKELQYSGHWAVPPSLFNLRSMFFNALGLHYSV